LASKEKLLLSAQKNLKKRLLPRAIKDFAKVVDIDPNDMRSRQKLAELYAKTGKSTEAFEQYETVAKYFSGNGFYLKAIAIYRQMQRLDPSQITIFARLAELNEKQGLIGNAMAEYRQLVSYYEKEGQTADVIRILEKMQDVDPENLNIQVKLAEVYSASGRQQEGREYFDAALKVLQDKQNHDKILQLYAKFLPLFSNDDELRRGLAETLIEKGQMEKALGLLQSLLREQPEDPVLLEMLATTYRGLDDLNNCRLTYQQLLKKQPNNLDLRTELVRCCLDSDHFEQALQELEEWKEAFQKQDRLAELQTFYESLKQALPDNRTVVNTLDSIYRLTGDGDPLLNVMETEGIEETAPEPQDDVFDALLDTASEDLEDDAYIDLGELEGVAEEGAIELEELDGEEGSTVEVAEEELVELELSDLVDIDGDEPFDLAVELEEIDESDAPLLNPPQDLEEAEFYLQQGLYDEAEKVCRAILAVSPDDADCQAKLQEVQSRREGSESDSDASNALHDLAVEVLDDDFADFVASGLEAGNTDKAGAFDDLLDSSDDGPIFRTDVDDQIAADDMESHYNLGIAYREMGLFDDAVSEFNKAQSDPARFVDCQTLKGLCYVDKGDFEKGEEAFRAALASTTIDEGQRLSLYYELGALYEAFQHPQEALASYRFVADADPEFRDIAEKVARLSQGDDSASTNSSASKDRISFL